MSGSVFLLGFLPALVVGGWILLSAMPAEDFNTSNWSRDIGVGGLVDDLADYVGAIAFALGLILGLTLDTTGPRPRRDVEVEGRRETAAREERRGERTEAPAEKPAEGVPVDRTREPAPEAAPRTGPPPRDAE